MIRFFGGKLVAVVLVVGWLDLHFVHLLDTTSGSWYVFKHSVSSDSIPADGISTFRHFSGLFVVLGVQLHVEHLRVVVSSPIKTFSLLFGEFVIVAISSSHLLTMSIRNSCASCYWFPLYLGNRVSTLRLNTTGLIRL